MSRSGYTDDIDQWDLIRWRGQVASTIRGKRGQAFLLEMWRAMQALPAHKLTRDELENEYDGAVCASVLSVRLAASTCRSLIPKTTTESPVPSVFHISLRKKSCG